MYGDDDRWSTRFPDLFRDGYVDYADCRIRCTTAVAPTPLVSRLHLVAVTSEAEVLVCRSEQGWRFLPGGTREPGESLNDLARRELMEEAGALLMSELRYFAAHVADSARKKPFRSHLPHPRTYWAYAVVDARVVGAPTNPPDGEDVVEVLTLTPFLAADFIEKHDPVHADLLRLADAMGLLRRPD
ncbi:MAG: NUDIX hydrolase [Nocardioidaceae bacterium]